VNSLYEPVAQESEAGEPGFRQWARWHLKEAGKRFGTEPHSKRRGRRRPGRGSEDGEYASNGRPVAWTEEAGAFASQETGEEWFSPGACL
jgi:hypothetical protein